MERCPQYTKGDASPELQAKYLKLPQSKDTMNLGYVSLNLVSLLSGALLKVGDGTPRMVNLPLFT